MNIVGISFSGAHDSGACIVQGEKLSWAASEERFTRICHDSRFPHNAIREGLNYCNLNSNQVDYAVIAWSSPLSALTSSIKSCFYGGPGFLTRSRGNLKPNLQRVFTKGGFKQYEKYFGTSRFIYCDHHLAHAISAFAYSGFDEATILVVDGQGAFEASSIWYASRDSIQPVEIIRWPNSLGLFYAKLTYFLGFQPLADEWKIMGLAAYGNAGVALDHLIDTSNTVYRINYCAIMGGGLFDLKVFERLFGPRRLPDDPIEQRHKDIAFAGQLATERAMLNLARYAIQQTGEAKLCLAGGVALNCKANGLIANSEFVDQIFVQPAASDEGAALGAALFPYFKFEKRIPKIPFKQVYYGPKYEKSQIKETLKAYKLSYFEEKDSAKTIAELLCDGKIIAIFKDRMEFGPRGLGNRSILADPRSADMRNRVNDLVKYRETWRPFAPAILEEFYFDLIESETLSPFMVLSFHVKESYKEKIPAVVHVDGTARPQSVSEESNLYFWQIINEFYKKTEIPALLNTSFNLKGEPIVCNVSDAIRTFYTSGLDVLVLDDFLLIK